MGDCKSEPIGGEFVDLGASSRRLRVTEGEGPPRLGDEGAVVLIEGAGGAPARRHVLAVSASPIGAAPAKLLDRLDSAPEGVE